MIFHVVRNTESGRPAVPMSLRCPSCRQNATLDPYTAAADMQIESLPVDGRALVLVLASRHCPNPSCGAHIFVVARTDGTVLESYPAETIDFDSTDLPEGVVRAFEEAIKSHAQQCFTAAAIMVRKTLEEVCQDRGASGDNLRKRLQALGSVVVLPKALLDGLDDLRLLGNDAAHVESRVFTQVDREEVEIAIDVAKEILKATYQYNDLISRLADLKRFDG
jgi:hypothetical protein